MKNLKTSIIGLFITIFMIRCEYKDIGDITRCSGEPIQVAFDPLLPNGANEQCFLQNLNSTQQRVDLIIQTQADYEKYLSCTDAIPKIDFTQKTLLAGRYIAPNSDYVFSQSVYEDCRGNYTLDIILGKGLGTTVTNVFYFCIISKISSKATVSVNVSYKQ